MSDKLDSVDEQIITMLQRYDAPRSKFEMASELGVSPATVRRRIRKLTKAGIVSIRAVVDPQRVGLQLAAMIAFHVDGKKLPVVMEALKGRPAIAWLSSGIGRFDIMALARFSSMEELRRFVQGEVPEIDGVTGTETFLCLQEEDDVRTTLT